MAIPGLIKRNNNHLGVTKPISLGDLTEFDVIKTKKLQKFLIGLWVVRELEGSAIERGSPGRLDPIVKNCVKKISRQMGLKDKFVQEANGKNFTLGSYRLEVHGPGADIDTLCVGPRHATRERDFFVELHNMLAEMP